MQQPKSAISTPTSVDINNMRYKRLQSLIQDHMRHVRSEFAREQRIALYKRYIKAMNNNNNNLKSIGEHLSREKPPVEMHVLLA